LNTMKVFLDKFDWILLFILLLGFAYIGQLTLLNKPAPISEKNLLVQVSAPIDENVNDTELSKVNALYFSNAAATSSVISIVKVSPSEVQVLLRDKGMTSDSRIVFAGQHVGLNSRVRLHGAIELEGIVTKILND